MLRVLDLFSGIGGFSLGLESTGLFETVAFCEYDDHKKKVIKKHWPNVPVWHDVRLLNPENFTGRIDVLTGGFPCTDLSACAKGSHKGLDGQHSGLFFELARIAEGVRPDWLLIENVPHVKKWIHIVRQYLPSYELQEVDVDTTGIIPSRRKRCIIVGSLRAGGAKQVCDTVEFARTAYQTGGHEDHLPMLLPWKGGVSFERLGSCIVEDIREGAEIDPTRIREGARIPRGMDGRRYLMLGDCVPPALITPFGWAIGFAAKNL